MKVLNLIFLLFKFFILGLVIIIGAVFLNLFAEILGFYTWYDLFINTQEAFENIGITDAFFIFIIYPISLGILASSFGRFFKNKTSTLK